MFPLLIEDSMNSLEQHREIPSPRRETHFRAKLAESRTVNRLQIGVT